MNPRIYATILCRKISRIMYLLQKKYEEIAQESNSSQKVQEAKCALKVMIVKKKKKEATQKSF